MAMADAGGGPGRGVGGGTDGGTKPGVLVAAADFEPSQMQDLSDLIPRLLEIKAKASLEMKFHVRLEIGDGTILPGDDVVDAINKLLEDVANDFSVT